MASAPRHANPLRVHCTATDGNARGRADSLEESTPPQTSYFSAGAAASTLDEEASDLSRVIAAVEGAAGS